MWHELVGDESTFFTSLIASDEQLAEQVRQQGCVCGGRLDRADYPRKPRGLPAAWEEAFSRRISFCCAEEGCRKRSTPPSLRFFGRRVYVAAIILVVCGRWTNAGKAGVLRNTARRWRRFFSTDFLVSRFWQDARSRLMPPIISDVIEELLSRFSAGGGGDRLRRALRFLCPCTTESSAVVMAS